MSIYMVAFRGGMPLGSLASGYLASLTSAPTVLSVNGGLVSLIGLYFLLKSPSVRTLLSFERRESQIPALLGHFGD